MPAGEESQLYQQAQAKFRALVLRCMVACSIKNQPDEYTLSLLWNYVSKSLSTCTFKEIETAIVFNATGKLEVRVDHFQVFDLKFLSAVMEEWFVLKNKTRVKIAGLLPKPAPERIETPYERFQGLLNYINTYDSFPDHWAYSEVYRHMDESGQIKDTLQEKKDLWQRVKSELEAKLELELLSVSDFIEKNNLREKLPDQIKFECQKRTVKKNLQHLIDTNKPSST